MSEEINMDDLLNGIEIPLENDKNQAYNLFKEELEELADKKQPSNVKKSSFFSKIPKNEISDKINKILKREQQSNEILFHKKLQIEFDKKMARINKIKSKNYRKTLRKEKKKREQLYEELNFSSSAEESNESVDELVIEESSVDPLIHVNTKKGDFIKNQELINEAFESESSSENVLEEKEKDFEKEKVKIMNEDAPKIEEIIYPGLGGEWAGEGLEIVKNKHNTVVNVKEGLKITDRIDFTKSNVIVNENIEYDEKYAAKLPYGFSSNMYKKKLKLLKNLPNKNENVVGEEIEMKKVEE
ncbi:hypothetical protein NUSPORA_02184 [Nucleospora cyclopteri]